MALRLDCQAYILMHKRLIVVELGRQGVLLEIVGSLKTRMWYIITEYIAQKDLWRQW